MGEQAPQIQKTALHDRHVAAGAEMVQTDYGAVVPDHYTDPPDEVRAVRQRAGVLDISHLGRIRIRGDGALELMERLCTADVAHQEACRVPEAWRVQ